jgi:hypothetical protein
MQLIPPQTLFKPKRKFVREGSLNLRVLKGDKYIKPKKIGMIVIIVIDILLLLLCYYCYCYIVVIVILLLFLRVVACIAYIAIVCNHYYCLVITFFHAGIVEIAMKKATPYWFLFDDILVFCEAKKDSSEGKMFKFVSTACFIYDYFSCGSCVVVIVCCCFLTY